VKKTPTGAPEPKRSEVDPPAADGPVDESPGSPPAPSPSPREQAGRAANDPSLSGLEHVPEVMQAPPTKPDGEVDTAQDRALPKVKRRLTARIGNRRLG
jgi:hypothetical protein